MPFWSRIDSGTHANDSSLSVHIRTHGRQRHDSIISHVSSVLGDNDTADLVTLKDIQPGDADCDYQKMTLEDVLNTLPGEDKLAKARLFLIVIVQHSIGQSGAVFKCILLVTRL